MCIYNIYIYIYTYDSTPRELRRLRVENCSAQNATQDAQHRTYRSCKTHKTYSYTAEKPHHAI